MNERTTRDDVYLVLKSSTEPRGDDDGWVYVRVLAISGFLRDSASNTIIHAGRGVFYVRETPIQILEMLEYARCNNEQFVALEDIE